MRCKCCDSINTRYILGDWYCPECSSSIHQTIKEDKDKHLEDWFYRDLRNIKVLDAEEGDSEDASETSK